MKELGYHMQYLDKKNQSLEKDIENIKALKTEAEKKFEEGLADYKKMMDETSQGYTNAKKQEIYLAEKMASMVTDLDLKTNELNEVKRVAVNLDQENQSIKKQVENLEVKNKEFYNQI